MNGIIEALKVLVFGIAEGFTELLPVSSTGHLVILDELIPLLASKRFKGIFAAAIQLGAMLSVVVLYFQRLNPFSALKKKKQREAIVHLWFKIFIACIPVGVMGYVLNDWINANLMNNRYVISSMFLIYGVLLIVMERWNKTRILAMNRVLKISYKNALFIGLFQILALVPGTPRAGVIILGAMLLGCSRGAAAELSFFLGIPVIFGAGLYRLGTFGFRFSGTEIFYLILGMITAFWVSVYSIKFLVTYIRNNDYTIFGCYQIVMGIVVLCIMWY